MRQRQGEPAFDVAAEISRYIEEHPDACDTVAGVIRFWLNRDLSASTVPIVEAALATLIASGELERRELPGGDAIFRRTRNR